MQSSPIGGLYYNIATTTLSRRENRMFAQQDLVSLLWWKTNRAKQSLAKLEWDAKHNRGDIWINVWGWNPLPLLTVLNNRETIIIIIIIIIIMLCVHIIMMIGMVWNWTSTTVGGSVVRNLRIVATGNSPGLATGNSRFGFIYMLCTRGVFHQSR